VAGDAGWRFVCFPVAVGPARLHSAFGDTIPMTRIAKILLWRFPSPPKPLAVVLWSLGCVFMASWVVIAAVVGRGGASLLFLLQFLVCVIQLRKSLSAGRA
jgi:hypothetical protein